MNKIKIYFRGDWVFIAPPWLPLAVPLSSCTETESHDIGVNINKGTAYVTNDDYYCSVNTDEMRTLIRMLEMSTAICEEKMSYKDVEDLINSYMFRGTDVYLVGEIYEP